MLIKHELFKFICGYLIQDSISAEKEIDQVEKLKEVLQQRLATMTATPSGGYQFAVPNSNPYSGSVSNVFNISPVMSNVMGAPLETDTIAGATDQVFNYHDLFPLL